MNDTSLADRLAVRELIEEFAVAAMLIDGDRWGETWAEESIWQLPSMPEPAYGRPDIVATFKEKMSYLSFLSMISVPADIVIDGDHATGKAYCQEIIVPKTGSRTFVVGCYDDAFIRADGRWRFKSRYYSVLGRD